MTTLAEVVAALDKRYPPATAESWDRVGLVVGEPSAPVRRALLVVDCTPETVTEALNVGVDLIVAHHPLLLRGVHSVATTTYKGSAVHRLIRGSVALFVAHTNADLAAPGVSDALADRIGLVDVFAPAPELPLRIGKLPETLSLAGLAARVADRLPATSSGVRAAGAPDLPVRTVAVAGGAGDAFLSTVQSSDVDAYLTADLRHHVAGEHLADGGPALVEAAHWATERPWLDALAGELATDLGLDTVVSDLVTDPWTIHVEMGHVEMKGRPS
jgi:dinuclear metal center YbgI/SA1388 family protein